jgi:hypothetical protein
VLQELVHGDQLKWDKPRQKYQPRFLFQGSRVCGSLENERGREFLKVGNGVSSLCDDRSRECSKMKSNESPLLECLQNNVTDTSDPAGDQDKEEKIEPVSFLRS